MFSGSCKVRDGENFESIINGMEITGDDAAAGERDMLAAAARRAAVSIYNDVDDLEGDMTVSISGLATKDYDCEKDGDNPHVTVTLTLASHPPVTDAEAVVGEVTEHTAAEVAKASH